MLFDLHFWPTALLFAALSAAFAFWLGGTASATSSSRRGYDSDKKEISPRNLAITAAIITFVIDLLLQRINLYYFQPNFTGSFFGYFSPLLVALLAAIPVGLLCSGGSGKAIARSVVAVLILFIVPVVQICFNSVGPDNAKRFAELPNITIAKDTDIIPPTDEQHLVQVTPKMAELKARTVLSSKGNYSTRYTIGKLVLQAIKGHRYYAAPLVPTNSNDTFWTPLFGGRTESPGYVLVDAEDKEAHPQLKDGFHITLFQDMPWSMNLSRFAYQAGYDKGDLSNLTFEVDDELQPHYSITYVTPAFGNIVGSKIEKVLLIDVATAEPKLTAYEQGAPEIKWVDRVVSSDLIREYAKDWGLYGQAYSQSGFGAWLQVFLGLSKQDVMAPADGDEGQLLSYTKDEHSIFIVPMTSRGSTDHGVIGVLAFETDKNKAVYYPGLRGFNHGGSVSQTMFGARENGLQKYDVENLELYNIYGHLTWVAIYTKSQSLGSTGAAIGFMDARSQEVSDVAYGTDLQSALREYATKLAQGSNGMQATAASEVVSFDGKIWRIAPNGASWRFQLVGDNHYYDATTQVFPGTPLLRDGDRVSGTFIDTRQPQVAVRELRMVGNGASSVAPAPVSPAAPVEKQ